MKTLALISVAVMCVGCSLAHHSDTRIHRVHLKTHHEVGVHYDSPEFVEVKPVASE